MPDFTNLGTNTTPNVKINEVKGKIPSFNKLATNSALAAVKNEIPHVSNLVKKN